MTNENTTTTALAATLTEKELFGQFLKMKIQHWTNFGTILTDYMPAEALRTGGEWWDLMEYLGENLADALEADDNPTYGLETMISDLEDYIGNLRLVLSDFRELKGLKLIMPEEPDEADGEAYAAWEMAANEAEDNPRYHPVMDASEAQEAA